jgi:hypothetical protein
MDWAIQSRGLGRTDVGRAGMRGQPVMALAIDKIARVELWSVL